MYSNIKTLMDEKFQYLYLLLPECIAEGFAVPLLTYYFEHGGYGLFMMQ